MTGVTCVSSLRLCQWCIVRFYSLPDASTGILCAEYFRQYFWISRIIEFFYFKLQFLDNKIVI